MESWNHFEPRKKLVALTYCDVYRSRFSSNGEQGHKNVISLRREWLKVNNRRKTWTRKEQCEMSRTKLVLVAGYLCPCVLFLNTLFQHIFMCCRSQSELISSQLLLQIPHLREEEWKIFRICAMMRFNNSRTCSVCAQCHGRSRISAAWKSTV